MGKYKNRKKKIVLLWGWEFIKLQLAGNIPFWGTYLLFTGLDKFFYANYFQALLVSTVAANTLFFVIDDRWVFNHSRKKRKTTTEIWRFVVFMSFSALLTFDITWQLYQYAHISVYIGQFISAGFSTLWTFTGLKFWVFAPPRHHGLIPPKKPSRV